MNHKASFWGGRRLEPEVSIILFNNPWTPQHSLATAACLKSREVTERAHTELRNPLLVPLDFVVQIWPKQKLRSADATHSGAKSFFGSPFFLCTLGAVGLKGNQNGKPPYMEYMYLLSVGRAPQQSPIVTETLPIFEHVPLFHTSVVHGAHLAHLLFFLEPNGSTRKASTDFLTKKTPT